VMPAAKPVSQVSPASTMALPHTTGQSGSLMAEAPVGQQKSPALAVVMSPWKQMALQVLADSKRSAVQKLVSGQSLAPGQAPERPTATAVSQNSPGSMVPLPHVAEQSGSVRWVASAGQQPSLGSTAVTGSWVQVAVQPEPKCLSLVQASMSSQLAGGQAPTMPLGMAMSQVSPRSMRPLPQLPPASGWSASAPASSWPTSGPASAGHEPSQSSQRVASVVLPGATFWARMPPVTRVVPLVSRPSTVILSGPTTSSDSSMPKLTGNSSTAPFLEKSRWPTRTMSSTVTRSVVMDFSAAR